MSRNLSVAYLIMYFDKVISPYEFFPSLTILKGNVPITLSFVNLIDIVSLPDNEYLSISDCVTGNISVQFSLVISLYAGSDAAINFSALRFCLSYAVFLKSTFPIVSSVIPSYPSIEYTTIPGLSDFTVLKRSWLPVLETIESRLAMIFSLID